MTDWLRLAKVIRHDVWLDELDVRIGDLLIVDLLLGLLLLMVGPRRVKLTLHG